jgi:hypothetical protein
VYLPLWHGTFEGDVKSMRSVSVLGTKLDNANLVELNYKTDPTQASYTAFGTDFNTAPRQRADFLTNTSTYLADLDVVLKSSSNLTTPQVTAVALHHAVRPALIKEYAFSVVAADGLTKRDGRPLPYGATRIRTTVQNAAASAGSVTAIFPDETNLTVTVNEYGENLAWDERTRRWQAGLEVKAVQYKLNTVYGTWARAQPYTWNDVKPMTWQQIQAL